MITNLSNSEVKKAPSLAIVFARELAELMGGNPSRLYQWGTDLGLPMPRARQTFYSHLASDGWEMESERASSESCRMGSRPLNCQLRVRVVSLVTQFRRDIRAGQQRQLIVLLGYEVGSRLIHFRVYRGPAYDAGDGYGVHECERIPVATVAAFVNECGRMVGLPLERVLLTQQLMDFKPVKGKKYFLSLTEGKMVVRKSVEEAGDNEVLCSFGSPKPCQTLDGEHPFSAWCGATNATQLTAGLSDLVKRHNKAVALPRLEDARKALDKLLEKSHVAAVKAPSGSSKWELPQSAFQARIMKHDYALERMTLHEVRFIPRQYERFEEFPGDCAP